jgi:hypothetical protein
LELIHDLVDGEFNKEQLAEKYGVTREAIYYFEKREAAAIREAEEDSNNELAALWIARKEKRLAEYEADVDLVNERLDAAGTDGLIDPALMLRKHQALRASAEELGALNEKLHVEGQIKYVVEGVDPGSLR